MAVARVDCVVGREAELDALHCAAVDAAGGRGGLVLVGGEPGIGKTRLAEEVARRAGAAGVDALWARCWRADGVPAFWPWIQLIRAHSRLRGRAALSAELGPNAAEVASLVPELVRRPHERSHGGDLDGWEARFRLFDSLTAFLRRAGETGPLLLVIDDLHWADPASVLLLQFLARELSSSRLLVVGTYRDMEVDAGHPLLDLLRRMPSTYQHHLLLGLDRAQVAELIGMLTASRPAEDVVTSVHRRTNGNPLFVRELLRLLASGDGPDPRVPEGVREVIRWRLDRLSGACRTLLAAAAVIGQASRLALLEAVSGVSGDELAASLAEAASARLLEEVPGATPRYGFAHALVAEVLYGGLPVGLRQQLHLRAGTAIERLFQEGIEARSAQLARHFRMAGPAAPPGRAVGYATLAGRSALRLLAYEEASGHFERAVDLLESSGTRDIRTLAELVLSLADCQMSMGQLAVGRATHERAAALARTAGAADQLARIALSVGLGHTAGLVDNLEIRLLEEALEAVGEADSAMRTRLMARLAVALHATSSLERRRQLSGAAVAMARRIGDTAALAEALLDRHWAVFSSLRAEERLAICAEVARLARRGADQRQALRARAARLGDLLEVGDMDAFRTELEVHDRMAGELRRPQYRWTGGFVRACQAVLAGRLDEGERLADEGRRDGRRMRHPGVEVYHLAIVAVIRYLQGRLPELEGELRACAARFPAAPAWRGSLAVALAGAGRDDEARRELRIATVDDLSSCSGVTHEVYSLAVLALACDAAGDTRGAALVYPLLSRSRASYAQVSATVCLGSAEHYLGLLSCTLSRWDEACRHFESAIAMNARIGAAPFVAISRFQHARALMARDRPGARAEAEAELDRAVEAARALGMRLWRDGAAGSQLLPPAAAACTSPLTRREWDVARLVAEGLSNIEIAGRLFISKRTVETHVEHIRHKLGSSSRAGIMSWTLRNHARQRDRDGGPSRPGHGREQPCVG